MTFGQTTVDLNVGQRTLPLEDRARGRKLITEVWYPTTQAATSENAVPFVRIPTARDASISSGKFPLVLFSHGTGGGRLTVEWFCAGLASKGFIVAAVDHFGNTFDNSIPEEFVKFWERPQDLKFVLDNLLSSGAFASSIDDAKIGVAGFSLGGYTAIALAGGQLDLQALQKFFESPLGKKEAEIPEMPGLIELMKSPKITQAFTKAPPLIDRRIRSAFVMSPALGQGFPERENLRYVKIPVYIVAASADHIAPIETNAKHYAELISKSKYQALGTNADHYVFLNEANDELRKEAPIFFSDPPGVDRTAIHQQALSLALTHFKSTLK
jgi:predicted dienelactone hydrolase